MAQTKTQTYLDILAMDPLPFLNYLEQFNTDVSCNVDNAEEMIAAGNKLGDVANNYSYLVSLYAYAGVRKRQLSRTSQTEAYQDMIDKESALECIMRAVDMQYRALSKALSVHVENNKELYYTDGYAVPKNRGRRG